MTKSDLKKEKIIIICIPASLLRGFEEALLAAVPEPSYLLMPTIATRCWQHGDVDDYDQWYYLNQSWCRWWSFHCLNPQLPQKAANGPDGGSAATMGSRDHWEQVFFQLWLLICLVVPNDEDQTFADDIDHSLGGVCWWFSIQFPWLGSLNGDLNFQVPKVPSPSLHSCNVKSVPRCSTCVQAWTMQHFWSYKCSKNRIPVIWYFILMNFIFFLFV